MAMILNVDVSGYYRGMLTEISKHLSTSELDSMKYWCRSQNVAGRAILEDIDEPAKLWDMLEKRGRLSQRDLSFLIQMLKESVKREDLIRVIEGQACAGRESPNGVALPSHGSGAGSGFSLATPGIDAPASLLQTHTAPRDTGNNHAEALREERELISEEFGAGWRTFARKLELPEATIDSIAVKYPTDLKEQIQQAIKLWCSKKGEAATRDGLVAALRQCQRNKLARRVEEL